MREERRNRRRQTYFASRSIICLVVAGSLGSLLWTPANILLGAGQIYYRALGSVAAWTSVGASRVWAWWVGVCQCTVQCS